ncbi:putative epidermal differentiation-specific protein-like [Triplophysa rosa]|uniref:Epidermal differentiation-specific protein-like n=1 Tax=Triplophysa rosa TaxID=992332 RepID=A0A9W7X559_TRIRA|nr:putative epidermal differentiation-specific protein-like [Triplophysa rosa]
MSKIIVYTGEGFTDRRVEFNGNVPNLVDKGLNDSISSLKVIGAPWVAYYDVNYVGNQRVFEEGEYPTLVDNRQFSSLRMITEDLRNPEIQLFEHNNYGGRSVILKRELNLHQVDFSDTASSHKVKSGVWVLYTSIPIVEGGSSCPSLGKKFPIIVRSALMMCSAKFVPCCQKAR